MVLFNYSTKELTAKIVYYGPGLCGKTTNLQFIHQQLSSTVKGKMLSLATKTDRTLFFDFLPLDLGEIRGMKTRMQLYTVPGQVFYNETRKLVLKGVDGIVFVADSQKEMLGPNIEACKNLEENLKGHGLKLSELPHVLQFNKRDLPKLSSIEELNAAINKYNAPFYESVATTGIGVQDSLKAITKLVLLHLTSKYDPRLKQAATGAPAAAEPKAPAARAKVERVTVSKSKAGRGRTASVPAERMPRVERPSAGIPLSAASRAAVATVGRPDLVEPLPGLATDEIDDLVCEVSDAGPLEIQTDSSLGRAAVVGSRRQESPAPAVSVAVVAHPADEPSVRLQDALTDAELFADPSLEVARLVPGVEREILIPVEVGQQGAEMRRFKLRVLLRVDNVG